MVDVPSPVLPAPELPTPPRQQRRWLLIGSSVALVIVLLGLGGGAVWLLWRTAAPPPSLTGSLPSSAPGQPPAAETNTPSPGTGTESIPEALLVTPGQNNLAVSIRFTRQPQFQLTIENLAQTIEESTSDRRTPLTGASFSLLRVRDATGGILHEQPFAVTTQVELVSSVLAASGSVKDLETSTTYIVFPVTAEQPPTEIEITTSEGKIFDRRSFVFTQLPVAPASFTAARPQAHQPGSSRILPTNLGNVWRTVHHYLRPIAWARHLGPPHTTPSPTPTPTVDPTAPATTAQPSDSPSPSPSDNPSALPSPSPSPTSPCSRNCFNIVVLGHDQDTVRRIAKAAREMVESLEPWQTYASQVNVVPITVPPNRDVGCFTIEGVDGGAYPLCPDGSAVAGAITGIDWHTIITVTDVDCNCGTVEDTNTSDTAAVGSRANADIIGHELGHSVGRMVDEYYYQFGITGGPLGPNCFDNQPACQDATTQLTGAQCVIGCRAVNTWRPSTKKMHSLNESTYGPLEECIMAEQIRKVVGGEAKFGDCEAPEPSIQPPPPPARPEGYYGGNR